MPQAFIKDPDSVLDYVIDWTEWLGLDTITTSTWQVPTGITEDSSEVTEGKIARIWLSGGAVEQSYVITNRIVTANSPSRIEDRTIEFRIKER